MGNHISRRPFLMTTVGAGLAATFARAQEEKPAGKKLGWAIVGLAGLAEKKIAHC